MTEPARAAASPAIEVHDLTRRFGDFVAVDEVSFDVRPGEIFGFLGPNGAGKTTTIKMLTGLLAPSAGSASVAGHDVVRERDGVKASIGYMSQLFSLYGDLTVEENIAFFAGLYDVAGERRERRRDWVLEMSGLAGESKRLTAELSLGWKQRLALGCAVLHEPPILFLDEPTSGVDPISRRRFWDLIDSLAAGGTTVLVSTHYMEEAEYCHRLALMNRGRLIALDSPSGLRRAAREPLLELIVDDAVAALPGIEATPGVLRAGLFGRTLHVAVEPGGEPEAELRRRLERAGRELRSLRVIEPTLEDVFIARVAAAGGAPED
ncbi:MAG TPA: ABC transporter ATP-binding protein [Thermoanaerobaculia bacterium]|nr:ABC transporter ATP-binding protein [Thermoanaerobaculia bacterium]